MAEPAPVGPPPAMARHDAAEPAAVPGAELELGRVAG